MISKRQAYREWGVPISDQIELDVRARMDNLMVADLPDFIVRTCSTEYLLSLLERDMQRVSGVWLKGVLLG